MFVNEFAMPEGPTIILLKEEVAPFKGKKILKANGYAEIDHSAITNKKIIDLKTWGKHFLICLKKNQTIRIHFLLFGSYLINKRKKTNPRLQLQFAKGEINFYMSSIKILDGDLDEIYDWSADVMNEEWDEDKARRKLTDQKDMLVCDALLDQDIFAGVGNVIKNEVLYRLGIHPLSAVGALPKSKISQLIKEVRKYSFEFLEWKRKGTLKSQWKVHRQQECPKHEIPLCIRVLGKTKRKAYYCEKCQVLYV